MAPRQGANSPVLMVTTDLQELSSAAPPSDTNIKPTSATSRRRPPTFTQSQLALAITIQRSIPADLSTREYCVQLGKNIKLGDFPGRRDCRHVDSPEFWKDQYTQIYLQKTQLEIEVCRLEQVAMQLRKSNPGVSRSVPETLLTESTKSSKQKAPQSLQFAINELQVGQILDQPVSSRTVTYLPLLVHAQVLYRLLQDNKVSPDTLLASQKSTISFMTKVIVEFSQICSRRMRSEQQSFILNAHQAFAVVAAVFSICLQSLGHLCRDITGRRSKGVVVHALVKSFAEILDNIQSLCSVTEESDTAPIRATRHRLRVRQDERRQSTLERSPLLLQFTHLAKNILLCPELFATHSGPVLEGILSVLLSRIGNLMSESVFGAQIGSSRLNAGIATVEEPKRSDEQETAVQLEGRHLAWALDQAITSRAAKERNTLLTLLGGQKTSLGNVGNETLFKKARQRLQDTLLTGIFGVDGKNFLTALKVPENFGQEWRAESTNFELAVVPSFVQSIWSTVGWQILEKQEK